jgi:hypothetical protein
MLYSARLICSFVLVLLAGEGLFPARANAQTIDERFRPGFSFLPGSPLAVPFPADYEEPRIGIRKDVGSSRITLDLGSMFDLIGYTGTRTGPAYRAGVDAFATALTSTTGEHRLQVDAADGYIGGHLTYADRTQDPRFTIRLRVLHLSGHLIDGSWDRQTGQWKDGKQPVPFTRNFIEIAAAWTFPVGMISSTVYTGFRYSFFVRPSTLAHPATLHGLTVRTNDTACELFGRPFVFYVSDHVYFAGIPKYYISNSAAAGVKFGSWGSGGIRLSVEYYTGLDRISQNYAAKVSLWTVGITADVW